MRLPELAVATHSSSAQPSPARSSLRLRLRPSTAPSPAAGDDSSSGWALPPLNQFMTLPGRFLASRNSLSASNNNTVTASRTNNTRDNLLHDEDERWTSRDHFVLPHMVHFQDEFEADDNTGPAPTQPPEEIDLTLSSSEDEGGSRSAGSDVIEILEPTDAAPQPTPLRRKRRRPGAAPLLVPKRQRTMDMKSAESTNVSIHNSDVVEEFKAQLKCSICLDVLEDMTSTLCGHIFCAQCVHQAIRANGKCPLCQRRLHLKDTHRIYF